MFGRRRQKRASHYGRAQSRPGTVRCGASAAGKVRAVAAPEVAETTFALDVRRILDGEGINRQMTKRSANPEVIASFSLGLARFREGPPWVVAHKDKNPEGVESQDLGHLMEPLQGSGSSVEFPRVARSSQPWAERCSPVGIVRIGDEMGDAEPTSTEKSLEPRISLQIIGNQRDRTRSAQPPGVGMGYN